MSTPSKRVSTPGRLRTGRTAAYRSSRLRSCTLTLVKPRPTGVVHGPLRAMPAWRTASTVASGSTSSQSSIAARPAFWSTQRMGAPAASSTRQVAAMTSGPMPSPAMRTTS